MDQATLKRAFVQHRIDEDSIYEHGKELLIRPR
jgi:hypothetical protein